MFPCLPRFRIPDSSSSILHIVDALEHLFVYLFGWVGVYTELAPSFELKWNIGCFWKYKRAFAMMTATTRKTSRPNICEVVIILRLSHLVHTMLVNYAPRGLVCAQLNSTQRQWFMIICSSCHQNRNCGISCPFPGDVRNFFTVHAARHTCIMIVFPDSTNQILYLWTCCCHSIVNVKAPYQLLSKRELFPHLRILYIYGYSGVSLYLKSYFS